MSKEEKKDRLKSILGDILGSNKPESGDRPEPTISQVITSGSNNVQISGNNNTVGKR